jgi:hypothetical protein
LTNDLRDEGLKAHFKGSKAHSKGGRVRKRTTFNGQGLEGALEGDEGSKAHSKGNESSKAHSKEVLFIIFMMQRHWKILFWLCIVNL